MPQVTLKQARLLADMSQAKVAEELGVHRHTYMSWEKNPDAMPIGVAKKFAQLTGFTVDRIFFDTESTLSR